MYLQTFDSQCAQVRSRFTAPWSRMAEISYYALQLQAYSFAISGNVSQADDANQAKALSLIVRMISEASKTDVTKRFWPFFPKYHILFAAAIGIYMAATTSQNMARLSLLEACKEAVPTMKSWSLFPKDQISRVAAHVATGVRRIESPRGVALGFTGRPTIESRMAANIPYRVIWSAKHGPEPVQNSIVTNSQHSSAPMTAFHASSESTVGPNQQDDTLQFTLDQVDDALFFEDMNDLDFTDIFLDWQSLRGPVPEWT